VLFTGTIAENIAYGHPTATRSDIEEAARLANCDFVWGMPDQFDTKSEFGLNVMWNELRALHSW
jgi:ABC-type multidrug transport system fused ATPase/permease subunit